MSSGPHESCYEGLGCCDEFDGPVYRAEPETLTNEEPQEEEAPSHVVERKGGSDYFYNPDRGISSPFIFLPKLPKREEKLDAGR